MSKERARRREVRQAEVAARAEARAISEAKAARKRDRRATWQRRLGPLYPRGEIGKQTGTLAHKRRTRLRIIVMALLAVQIFTWFVRPDWQARLAALVIAAFAFPVLAAFAL